MIFTIMGNLEGAATYSKDGIVVDKLGVSGTGTYNAAEEGIDDATVAGITALIPEASASALLMAVILCLFSIMYLRRRRQRQI